jgi:RNA polymerase sigma-70 factor (ECF subfamily)
MAQQDRQEFETFVEEGRPRLARALAACRGQDAPEAVAEALAFAWEHWQEVSAMENPIGYLFRVGQSRTRQRRSVHLPPPASLGLPDVEPGLVPALLALPHTQ